MQRTTIKAGAVAAVVLLSWSVPALGLSYGGGYTLTFEGSYIPEGLTTQIDVYTLAVWNTKPDTVIGSIDLCVGNTNIYGNPLFPNIYGMGTGIGHDPFQAWVWNGTSGTVTATSEAAAGLGTGTNAYKADSHLLVAGMWEVTLLRHEGNDGSLWDGSSNPMYGLGSIGLIAAVPVAERGNYIELMQIGIASRTIAYGHLGLWDNLGNVLLEKYYMGGDTFSVGGAPIIVPEPATIALLGAGALAARWRRR